MKFIAEIDVMPIKSLLDPQGKAVSASMGNVGLSEIKNVRIGKHVTLEIEAKNMDMAKNKLVKKCFAIL
jgi:phosphoribosylformylglycinamidine synthase PurS subunit